MSARLVSEPMPVYLVDADGPSLSSGIADIIANQSGLHAWHAHPRLNPNYRSQDKDEFDYGTAAHSLLLESDGSNLAVIDHPDYRTKAAREERDNARAQGKTPLLKRKMDRVVAMAETANKAIKESEIAEAWAAGISEQSLYWDDLGGKIKCKARFDRYTQASIRWIFDYKSCMSANPDAFLRSAVSCGYDMQEAFYRRGEKALTGKDFDARFVFVAQEKEEPFACSLIAFDPSMQEIADRKVAFAMTLWEGCITSGEWRGYSNRIHYMAPPGYYVAQNELMETMLNEGIQA